MAKVRLQSLNFSSWLNLGATCISHLGNCCKCAPIKSWGFIWRWVCLSTARPLKLIIPADVLASIRVSDYLVRFPNPLAAGSGLGFQYPKKWEIFLWGALAQPFGDAQGWVGAYWVPPDLDLPWPQCRIPTFTQCCCSGAFMSSSQSELRPPPNPDFVISYFFTVFLTLTFHISPQRHIFQLCWPIVQWLYCFTAEIVSRFEMFSGIVQDQYFQWKIRPVPHYFEWICCANTAISWVLAPSPHSESDEDCWQFIYPPIHSKKKSLPLLEITYEASL